MSDPRREVLRALALPRARRDGVWRIRTWDGSGSGADDAAAPMVARRSGRAGRPPSFATSNAATITLVTDEPQDFTETGTVQWHATTATRRAFTVPALPAAGPALPFGGIYSVQVDLPLVTPVPAGTKLRLVGGDGQELWRPDPFQWRISWPRVIGDVEWISLHVPGQEWPGGMSPRVLVEVPDSETVVVGADARCTWKMEGTPAHGPTTVLTEVPTANLVFDGDAEVQGDGGMVQVFDQSGNDNHSGTGHSLPWSADQVDGRAAWIGPDGTGSTSSNVPVTGGMILMCVVVRCHDLSSHNMLRGRGSSTSPAQQRFQINDDRVVLGNLGGPAVDSGAGAIPDTGWHMVSAWWQDTSSSSAGRLYVDDQMVGSADSGVPSSAAAGISLFRGAFDSPDNNMDVARILVYRGEALSTPGAADNWLQNEVWPAVSGIYGL